MDACSQVSRADPEAESEAKPDGDLVSITLAVIGLRAKQVESGRKLTGRFYIGRPVHCLLRIQMQIVHGLWHIPAALIMAREVRVMICQTRSEQRFDRLRRPLVNMFALLH